MQSQFCEWCGAPAVEGSELCKNCLDAQTANDRSKQTGLTPITPVKNAPAKQAYTAGGILLMIVKSIFAILMGFVMMGTALFGTCSVIIAGVSIFSAPATSAWFLFLAAVGLGLTFLIYKGITGMYRTPPKEIDRIAKAGTEDV